MEQHFCPLREWAIRCPDGQAMDLDGKYVSNSELDHWVETYRLFLADAGVRQEDRLLVLAEQPFTSVLLIIACLRNGIIFCPVNPKFPLQQVQAYSEQIGSCYSIGIDLSGSQQLILPELQQQDLRMMLPVKIEPERICDLIATSGTTGIPKAVAHSFKNHWCSAEGSKSKISLSRDHAWLLSLPLFHVGGFSIVIRCLLAGATMVVDSSKVPLQELLQQKKITHLSLVNTQLYRLTTKDGFDFSGTRVETVLLGGGYAAEDLVASVRQQGVELLTTYGLTEMSSQVCTGQPIFVNSGVTSGKALPYREVKLDDQGGIWVRGDTLAQGYYDRGRVIPFILEDGWYNTGDIGYWHQGNLKVTGRRDNMMISGGENIHPEEIEQALLSLDGIVQAIVVSIEHPEYGCRPYAFIETENDRFDPLFTKRKLAGTIGRLKIPDVIRLLPAEYSGIGIKPNRRLLQALARSDSGS